MKHIEELINRYLHNDIQLFLDNGELGYNAPKGALTQEMIAELSRNKQDIIRYFSKKNNPAAWTELIKPTEKKSYLPLSFSQEQLWILNRMAGIGSAYNMMSVFRLKGNLNIGLMHKAFNMIVRRHEILRSVYQLQAGVPVLTVQTETSPALQLKDFTSFNADERLRKAQAWMNEETQIPFDLQQGPLVRFSLGMLDYDDHLLVLTIHHIISDGWSMGVLFKEWEQLYNSGLAGVMKELPPLPIQYYDYATHQRERAKENNFQSDLDFWKVKLDGAPQFLEIPADYPRPATQTFNGNTERILINKNLTGQLKAVSKKHGSTLYMTLLSLFGALLSRYTRQEDIIIGSPVAGRNQSQTGDLIGYFVNTLPIRLKFAAATTLKDLFIQVKEEVLSCFEHQELPFETLVDHLNPERHKSYSPLVQVLFVMQNTTQVKPAFTGLNAEELKVDIHTAKLDLTLMLTETEHGLLGEWEYNSDLFKSETIRQMAACFEQICAFSVTNPLKTLADFSLLRDEDYKKIIIDWNRTQTAYPRNSTVHELFEEQARQYPEVPAVIFGEKSLTYGQLNLQAEKLKDKLLNLGLQKEEPVGICLERSFELIISLLAVLKAGGVYLPLDAGYPEKRISYMLEDARVNILLTQNKYKTILPQGTKQIICLDEPWTTTPGIGKTVVQPVSAENLAYIMYTSGSTGQPKGTTVPHRAIIRLVKNTNYVNLSGGQVFLQAAPVSFDAATFEIWGALLNGGQLVLPPPHTLSLKEIGEALKKYKVTTLWLTAGLFHLMVNDRLEDLRGVKQLLAGGDVLSVPHVKTVLKNLPGCVLINGYGPTENTTFSCCYPMTKEEQAGRTVPIGKPIANSQAYILDKYFQPVPVGVPGELCVGGDGLARGYLNRPDLTRERFIPHPFSTDPNARLYCTGDLARYLPDGNIEFIGRIDQQIKIRGFRIEIGEIEAAVASYPGVKETTVICNDQLPGGHGLVAYYVADNGETTSVSEADLRRHVEKWLPNYMHPVFYVLLEELPLNPNGKVDRKALPQPHYTAQLPQTKTQATSATAQKLVELAQKLLNTTDIQPTDNFFEKGGNSLAIIRLIAELEEAFHVSLTVTDFMELPSIADLAGKIDSLTGKIPSATVKRSENTQSPAIGEQLLAITRALLDINDITLDDNFFEKGGNSLAIIRLIAELEATFGVILTVGDFLELPNLNGLVEKIVKAKAETTTTTAAAEQNENALLPETEFPLSRGQEQLWFLERLEGIGSTYNISSALKFKGKLDLNALEQSVTALVRRHESLRTTFYERDGVPVQKINLFQPYRLTVIDLQGKEPQEQKQQVSGILFQESQQHFNLHEYPLWRFTVLQTEADEQIIVFTIHHIIFDGWSMGVFFTELSEFYKHYSSGAQLTLTGLPLQYRDFRQRQQQYLESGQAHAHIHYWKEKLHGAPAFLDLPIDKPRPAAQTFAGRTVCFKIPDHIYENLKTVNKQAESMLFMTLFTAYAALLSRWSGTDELVIGTPLAGRNKKDLESLIGYLVNILPVRIHLPEGSTFLEAIKQVKATILEAYAHQQLPFEKLVEAIQPPRDPAYSPLFQVMFHLYSPAGDNLQLPGIDIEDLAIENNNPTSKFDLILSITETKHGLTGDWEYNTDLFEAETITRLTNFFLELLAQATEAPDLHITQLVPGMGRARPTVMENVRRIGLKETEQQPASIQPPAVPLSDTQRKLLEIFERLFKLTALTVNADFFALGGHSMMIVQLVSEIEKHFQVDLSVMDIMLNTNILSLATLIENNREG